MPMLSTWHGEIRNYTRSLVRKAVKWVIAGVSKYGQYIFTSIGISQGLLCILQS